MSHDASHRYEWKTMPWRKIEGRVFKLQRRIYQATIRGETQKARSLQKLLAASWSAKSLAVRRVTQENKGKKTAGVDGVKSLTPPQRLKLISAMDLHAPVKPVRRIWIPKPGKLGERPLVDWQSSIDRLLQIDSPSRNGLWFEEKESFHGQISCHPHG